MTTTTKPILDAIDQLELDRLQSEVNAYRRRLKEFDRVVEAGASKDDYVLELLRNARGKILSEIQLRKTLWARYILRDPRDEPKISLLNTEV
jgi:hypothetical protein